MTNPAAAVAAKILSSTRNALAFLAVGLALCAIGIYLAPREAYQIQDAFRQFGETKTGIVENKRTEVRTFDAGGRRRSRPATYTEKIIEARLPNGQVAVIEDLVLSPDFKRLSVGNEVEISSLDGVNRDKIRSTLPEAPYYVLKSSVDAGTLELLPWAFNGRRASGLAIAACLPGFILVLLGGAILVDSRRAKR